MSNSTFNWWSLFLNTDENCKVYLPNKFEPKQNYGNPVMHTTSEVRKTDYLRALS